MTEALDLNEWAMKLLWEFVDAKNQISTIFKEKTKNNEILKTSMIESIISKYNHIYQELLDISRGDKKSVALLIVTENQYFKWKTPYELIIMGRGEEVINYFGATTHWSIL